MKCSPLVNRNGPSCYNSETLQHLRTLWNARHPDVPITTEKDHDIWKELNSHLKSVCKNEKCWFREEFSSDPHLKKVVPYTFLPDAPQSWKKKPKEWLTSTDISNVLSQYEQKHDNFRFIGPSPIDFDDTGTDDMCVYPDLCQYKVVDHLQNGIDKVGIVFNLDPHYKSGSHWVSMFVDYERGYIFFFDSTGDQMPGRVRKLVNSIKTQGESVGLTLKEHENNVSHQWGKSECGIYCLYMITGMLENNYTPKKFMNKRISDSSMLQKRKEFFILPE